MPLTNAAVDSLGGGNPFAILTFIAAPALLTNSSSVLALGTSNRFARAVDRARALAAKLEATPVGETVSGEEKLLLHQLDIAERRVLIVVRALGAFYFAVGAFGMATLTSLLGASFAVAGTALAEEAARWLALAAGVAGVSALVTGAALLVWESRLTRAVLQAEADFIRRRVQERREAITKGIAKAAD